MTEKAVHAKSKIDSIPAIWPISEFRFNETETLVVEGSTCMSGKHYSHAELARIKELADQGLGATAIARILNNRSQGGVQGQLARLGYVHPQRSSIAKARRSRQLDAKQHRQFCDFLRENIHRAPPIELMRFWNEQAPRFHHPKVSIDMVDYWIDKMRIRLSPAEIAVNTFYQQAKRQRYSRRSETARATFDSKAENRRRMMRVRRDEVIRKRSKLEIRLCPECHENWPLTEEFYRAKRDAQSNKIYFEAKGCILCANQTRRRISMWRALGKSPALIRQLLKSEERSRRNAKAQADILAAKELRAELVKRRKKDPQRTCLDCHEVWPMTEDFWKLATNGSYPRFCRFCDSRYRREQKRAKVDGRSTEMIRAARKSFLAQALDENRRARRKQLEQQANRDLLRQRNGGSRICSICNTHWPLTEDYWIFEPADGPRAGKLSRVYCRCCSHDKDARRNKNRRR